MKSQEYPYKDQVEKFEMLEKSINEAFSDFAKRLGKVFSSNKNSTGSTASDSATSILQKHQQDAESGGECSVFGTKPHGLFYSTTGAPDAYIGKNRNYVKNIMDFQISKRELRCYDLKKDPRRIGWLFKSNVKFQAEKIWGGPQSTYFSGVWYSGTFKGIWVGDWSNFKGGEFKGKYLNGQEPAPQSQKKSKGEYEFIPDRPTAFDYPQYLQQPPQRGKFEEGLKIIKKMIDDSIKSQI